MFALVCSKRQLMDSTGFLVRLPMTMKLKRCLEDKIDQAIQCVSKRLAKRKIIGSRRVNKSRFSLENGAPCETRTHNPWVRSFALNGLSSVFRSEFMLASADIELIVLNWNLGDVAYH